MQYRGLGSRTGYIHSQLNWVGCILLQFTIYKYKCLYTMANERYFFHNIVHSDDDEIQDMLTAIKV